MKYALNLGKFKEILGNKLDEIMKLYNERVNEMNDFSSLHNVLNKKQELLYIEVLEGKKNIEDLEKSDVDAIKKFIDLTAKISQEMEDDKYNLKLFDKGEISSHFLFTEDDENYFME